MLLAIVAVLFGAWTGDVGKAVDLKFEREVANRGLDIAQIQNVLCTKSLPLTVGSWLAAGVFFWRALDLTMGAINCARSMTCTYDDVSAAFVLTESFVILVAISATGQFIQLVAKLKSAGVP